MSTEDIAASFVALHEQAPIPPMGWAERRKLLEMFWSAHFDDNDARERRLGELQKAARVAHEHGAKAVKAVRGGGTSAVLIRVVENELAPYLDQLTIGFERDWNWEKVSKPLAQPDGTPFQYPRGHSPKLKLPLNLVYTARNVEAAIALAVLEEIHPGKSAGQCPFCHDWWISPDARRRRICGRESCQSARKAEWKKNNPEPPEQVRERVRRLRKRRAKTESTASKARGGRNHGKARTR